MNVMTTEYVKVSQASSGMTATMMTKVVRISMDAPTIIASIQLTPLSLNSPNATTGHPFMNMSALTKAMVMSSMLVSSIINAKKLELVNSGMIATFMMRAVKTSMDATTMSALKMS